MQGKGFFGALFDMSFSEFVTSKVIKFLYILLMILIAIGYLVVLVVGFRLSFVFGLLYLVVGAIVAVLYLILARIFLESIMVLFRIAENTSQMVAQGRSLAQGLPSQLPPQYPQVPPSQLPPQYPQG